MPVRVVSNSGGMFALGLGAALLASALFNVGIALQGLEAREAPRRLELRLSLLTRLLHRRLWLIGWALGLIGIAPQVLALATAPFVVVQPALAVGLLLLLALGARAFGEPIGAAEIIGVVSIIGGVALVAYGAPTRTESQRNLVVVVLVCVALAIPSLLPFLVRGTRLDSGMLAIVASGCGFGLTNIVTKLMSDAFSAGRIAAAAGWAVVGLAFGAAATLTGMTAFQRRAATVVVPVSTAVQTFLPLVLEPLFLRERWATADFHGAPIALGLALAFLGTVLVSRTRAVSALTASISGRTASGPG